MRLPRRLGKDETAGACRASRRAPRPARRRPGRPGGGLRDRLAVRKRSKCRSSGSPRLRPCCAAGVGFGHEVALPAAVHFLTNYDSGVYDTQIRASSYYSFAVLALLAVGLVFELPVLILGLVRFRVLTAAKLRRKPAHRPSLTDTAPLPRRRMCARSLKESAARPILGGVGLETLMGGRLRRAHSHTGVSQEDPKSLQPVEYPRLDRSERNPKTICDLRLGVAAVIGELECLALNVWNQLEGILDGALLFPNSGHVFGGRTRQFWFRGDLLAANGTPDEIDRASVHDHQQPASNPPPNRVKVFRRTPDGQERVLNRLLRKARIADNAEGKPECDTAEAVVELPERQFVARSDQAEERFVGCARQTTSRHGVRPRPRKHRTTQVSGRSAPRTRSDRTALRRTRMRRRRARALRWRVRHSGT